MMNESLEQINELMSCIQEVNSNLAIETIPNKVLLLMGETKAGKTTLMYYLLKKKLVLELNKELGIEVMRAEALFHNYIIGNNFDSTTVYPNIPPEIKDDCLIIDMPGSTVFTQASTTAAPSTVSSTSTSCAKHSRK
jgi:GTPase SAR1 family protein